MDASAFKEMFLPAHRRMYVAAMRLTGNAADAEDLVQETFLRLWTKRGELKNIGNAEAFAVTTMKNMFVDRTRKSKPQTCDIADAAKHLASTDSAEAGLVISEEGLTVMRLIDDLPENQRKVMVMRDIDDMGYDEICTQTGMPSSTVRSLISRARKYIRNRFEEIAEYERR